MRGTEQAEELANSAAHFFHVAEYVHYDRMMMHSLPSDNPGWSEAKGHMVQMHGQDLAAAVRLLAVAIRQVYDKLNQPRR